MKRIFVCILFACLLFQNASKAQGTVADTSFFQSSVSHAVDLYYKTIGENAHLYNGSEYMLYALYNKEDNKNLYFLSLFMDKGTVLYDGSLYEDIPLTYDILHDDLITNRYNQSYRIRLNADKVGYFTLAGHQFVRIVDDSAHHLPFGTGYYEKMYEGRTLVLAKRKKRLEERINGLGYTSNYLEDDRFFIRKDGIYYPVSTKKSVLNVFKDRKKDLKKFLRKNKISFAPHPEDGIIRAAQYYDQLKN